MAGGAGESSPPTLSLLSILFDDALVNISKFCNLHYISYIKRKPLKSVGGPYFACCLLVHSGVREKMKCVVQVLFCTSSPSHCGSGQRRGVISQDANYGQHRPRTRIKNLEPWQKIAYHTRPAHSFCAVFGYDVRYGAALAFLSIRGA